MNSEDYEDWVFLKEILLDLPTEYFDAVPSSQVKHYVQRLYDQAAQTPALDHLEITQVLEILFPTIFHNTFQDDIETEFIDLGTSSSVKTDTVASSSDRRPNTGKVQFELPKLSLGQTSHSTASTSSKQRRSASAPSQRKQMQSTASSSSSNVQNNSSVMSARSNKSIKPKTPRSKTASKNLYEFQFTEMEMPKDLQFKPGVNMRSSPRKNNKSALSQSLFSYQSNQTLTTKTTSPIKGRARVGSARMLRTAPTQDTLIPVTPNSRKPQTPVLPFLESVLRPGTAPIQGKQNRLGTTSGATSTTSSSSSSSSSQRPKTMGALNFNGKRLHDDDDVDFDSDSSLENVHVQHNNITANLDQENLNDLWDQESVNSSISSSSSRSDDEQSDDEAEEEEWERLGLLTGEDAVAFFAASSPDETVKFVYLNRAEQLDDVFRPYDLVIVPRQEVDPYEHFTMSPNGVVHVTQDHDTEYLSLSEWMRNATLFNMLTKINFFKFFLVGKMFRLWRSHVRYKKFCQIRNKLNKKLFWAQSAFVTTLLDVNSLCQDLHKVQVLDLDSIVTTVSLELFMDKQMNSRKDAIKSLEHITEKIQLMLAKLCQNVVSRTLVSDDVDQFDLDSYTMSSATSKSRSWKSISMVGAKKERAQRMAELKRACMEAQLLGNFIRLADYILCENLVSHSAKSLDSIVNFLKPNTQRRMALFLTVVSLDEEEGVMYTPDGDAFVAAFRHTVDDLIVTYNTVPRVLKMTALKGFFMDDDYIPLGPRVSSMIRSSKTYKNMRENVDSLLTTSFDKCVEQTYSTYHTFKSIADFNVTWDIEQYREREPTVVEFSKLMNRFREWFFDVDRMKPSKPSDLFVVDSKKLRTELLPVPQKCLQDIKDLAKSVLKTKALNVRNFYQNLCRYFEDKPWKLGPFTEYANRFKTLDEQKSGLDVEEENVDSLVRLLNQFDEPIPHQTSHLLDEMRSTVVHFISVREDSENFVMMKKVDMLKTLERNIFLLEEDLVRDMSNLYSDVYDDPGSECGMILDKLKAAKESIDNIYETAQKFREMQTILGVKEYTFLNLTETRKLYAVRHKIWSSLDSWNTLSEEWMTTPIGSIPVVEIEEKLKKWQRVASKLSRKIPDNMVVAEFNSLVQKFARHMPYLRNLGNEALRQRHWEEIYARLRYRYGGSTVNPSLKELVGLGIQNHQDFVAEISTVASGELALEIEVNKIKTGWSTIRFDVKPHQANRNVFILGSYEDVAQQAEDDLVTLQSLLASRYIEGIKGDVLYWERKLSLLVEVMEEWIMCQKNWLYLEVVFGSGDITRQLPEETAKFQIVDKDWKDFMIKAHVNPLVIHVLETPELREMFLNCNKLLEEILKTLEDYLETKRTAFPRFYFLSNDELLQILAQIREPKAVQQHLPKCFDGIYELVFYESRTTQNVKAMISEEGEVVEFNAPVVAKGKVEYWLGAVEKMMKQSLYKQLKECLEEYAPHKRAEWLFGNYPAQCILTVDQILWTHLVTDALTEMQADRDPQAIRKVRALIADQINQMVEMVRGDLSPLHRQLLNTLIVTNVHGRDVLDKLHQMGVNSTQDFEWLRQLRFYWVPEVDNCVIRQTNTSFEYGFEYLGNTSRLVITPLTDKCYLTLTSALHLHLGGAPSGPAGTGKTETTKDLAKSLGRRCVVYNCTEGLYFKMMGRFFAGLSQAGCWACFDEFNRIDIEVLSVIAQQLHTIQAALSRGVDRFVFEGREIGLHPDFGVFVTMNPGYKGRTELPDNLKALFRPVAMMIPDYPLIAEIILYSEGFKTAPELASKMVNLYRLSSQQLSQQRHYDFGMRALKSVLVMAGSIKRQNTGLNEDVLLIRALRDSNIPKLLSNDMPLFLAIVEDLFPDVQIPETENNELQQEVRNTLIKHGLQPVHSLIEKMMQLYDTMLVRHGVMLVGDPITGKSTCYKILAEALSALYTNEDVQNDQYQPVSIYPLNPKALSRDDLYGAYNVITREWKNGVVALLVNRAKDASATGLHWITFDGPVDAEWIEDMNTVLDDNKMLSLANGQRIKLPPTLTMLFETHNLEGASPATVSRCGMVFMETENLNWRALAESFCEHLETRKDNFFPGISDTLLSWMDIVVEPTLQFVQKQAPGYIRRTDNHIMMNFINLLDCMLQADRGVLFLQDKIEFFNELVSAYFVFCYIWSFGSNIDSGKLSMFSEFAKAMISNVYTTFPKNRTVFDYFVDENTAEFHPWDKKVPEYSFDAAMPFHDIVVPTVDTIRVSFLAEAMMTNGQEVLITGVSGVGKSVIIKDVINKLTTTVGSKYVSANANFSARTSVKDFQDMIEHHLEKRRNKFLTPPTDKKMLFYIDDVNMPAIQNGAQPALELLRQCIDAGGLYDTKRLFFKHVVDTQFLASCGPPGGGRNQISPRVLRHFNIINIPALSLNSMNKVFGSMLGGFLSNTVVSEECALLSQQIVLAAMEVYTKVVDQLLPTPKKSHYTFNIRDFSQVIQGIMQIDPIYLQNPATLIRLWTHESSRVFRDRLINNEDREWYDDMIAGMIGKYFEHHDIDTRELQNILFCDFLQGVPPDSDDDEDEDMEDEPYVRDYAEAWDLKHVVTVLEDFLDDYNSSHPTEMDIVFFRSAVEHIVRLCRILRQERGNAMLVGVSGSGRKTTAYLASHISGMECVGIEIKKTYGIEDFRENLKAIYQRAGLEERDVCFLLTDSQIIDEAFLEDINNLLNSGEVPGLYAADERESVISQLIATTRDKSTIPETKAGIFNWFVNKVRAHLHIVLCFSPIGDRFRSWCRQFPSLVNCCTIDWYDSWPDTALESVAVNKLSQMTNIRDTDVEQLSKACVHIHRSVEQTADAFYEELRRHAYTTPTSYLELLTQYESMVIEQRQNVQEKIKRFADGLNTLSEANKQVASLQDDLKQMQGVLEVATVNAQNLLEKFGAEKQVANKVKRNVEIEEDEVMQISKEMERVRDECEAELEEAMPFYNKAVEAVDKLDRKDITEMKSFKNPPDPVVLVMEAVCILKGSKPSWANGQKLMSDTQFTRSLEKYDKENIPDSILKQIRRYLNNPKFHPDYLSNVSVAATSLCIWVRAIHQFAIVYKHVLPRKIALAKAEEELAQSLSVLKKKQDELAEVEARVDALQEKYDKSEEKKQQLEDQMNETKTRLERAEKLVERLGDERTRWEREKQQLEQDESRITGTMFVAAAYTSYMGPFTERFRRSLLNNWMEFMAQLDYDLSADWDYRATLGESIEIRRWNMMGLPDNALAVENGLLVTNSRRWPLMIDPQNQANQWIKKLERENNLQCVRIGDQNLMRTLENSVRVGASVLLEGIDQHLDPMLDPILTRSTYRKAGRLLIRIGDVEVDFNPEFKLYITTKLPNPHFLPEVCIKVTLINFTVSLDGLEDQLLSDVVRNERPQLEESKDSLLVQINEDKQQLRDIEDKILSLLSGNSRKLLEDETLINTLAASKSTSADIGKRLEESQVTNAAIDEARNEFRAVAQRGALLYFVVSDLSLIDPMYQYSLSFFSNLFNQCIKKTERSSVLTDRIQSLINAVTVSIYNSVCRGLFNRDKQLFAFLMCTSVLRQDGQLSNDSWTFFLRGIVKGKEAKTENPCSEWLDDNMWSSLESLEIVKGFEGICKSFEVESEMWKEYAKSEKPHAYPLPMPWNASLSSFDKLILLRILRPEKVVFGTQQLVAQVLGSSFVEPPLFDLRKAYWESSPTTPIIFILSPGADPTSYLHDLAQELGYTERLQVISLGQGQGQLASRSLDQGKYQGNWVCLQNCHLSETWMPVLEKKLESQNQQEEVDVDFRLWLTSMPTDKFPVPILQNGLKLTYEPPRGVKSNLMRTYLDMNEDLFSGSVRGSEWKRMLFGLAFFHAVVQDRRHYGSIGFNNPYEWNNDDLQVSIRTLKLYMDEQEDPFAAIQYLIGEINYGGRVTDLWDTRTVNVLLEQFLNPEVTNSAGDYPIDDKGVYRIPAEGSLRNYRQYIGSLPINDPPQVFGLHGNADIVHQLNEADQMLNTILSIQPRVGMGGSQGSAEDTVLTSIQDMQIKLPSLLNVEDAHSSVFGKVEGVVNSFGTLLSQEIERYNELLVLVAESLHSLKRGIQGLEVMSAELEQLFDDILRNRVPVQWQKYPSEKSLGGWIVDLMDRMTFMEDWLTNGQPMSFSMGCLFFPAGLITAVMQYHARVTRKAVDTLSLQTHVLHTTDLTDLEKPEVGVYIHGMYLEGASWDLKNYTLAEAVPGKLTEEMPVIWLEPTDTDLYESMLVENEVYECPVYRTSSRVGQLSTTGHSTNFIFSAMLNSRTENPDHWVKRGVALLCSLKD